MAVESTLANTPLVREDRYLPREVVHDALGRLGWVSIALIVAAATVYFGGLLLQPGWISPPKAPLTYRVALGGVAACGAVMFILTRFAGRNLAPGRILDAAIVMEPLTGFFLSLAENGVSWPLDHPVRGVSSLEVWIILFAITVPTTYGKALLSAFATAFMGPVGLSTQIVLGNAESPPASIWFVLFGGNFLMAWAAPTLAKLIYKLAAQVKAAHEMGGYELVEPIGRGGMGEVWRARHRIVGRLAAVKLIRADVPIEHGNFSTVAKRFRIEAEATARLHSPHTVSLYDYGISDSGHFYYVMELLAGVDLQTLVTRFGPLPAPRAASMLIQVCDSLIEAHARGLVHRDVKPRNILACRLGYNFDFVKVLDFGLVKFDKSGQSLLTGEAIAGTPAFLSPEAIRGSEAVDSRSDLYGVGCVAYWLLTGRLVFERDSAMSMALAHVNDPPAAPSQITENEVPPELDSIVLDCLSKERSKRPQSALALRQRIAAYAQESPWTREMAEDWWRTHLPGTTESDLTPLPRN